MKKINIFAGAFVAFTIIIIPSITNADDKCVFTRDLEVGIIGEDVRCLQKFLNKKGYTVASSGIGSSGSETNMFGEKTKEALAKWQTSKSVTSGKGYFGPLSRSLYDTEAAGITATPIGAVTTTTTIVEKPIVSVSSTEKKTLDALKAVKKAIETAKDDIDDADDDQSLIDDAEETVKKAEDKLLDALYAFIDEDYEEATVLANRAKKYAEDSTEDLSSGSKGDAEDAIADAKEAISDSRADISDADDDGDDIDEAQDFYDEAREKYDDARSAFDDEDYAEAEDLANEARDLAEEASDAL
ncbi:MAG: peptidoglycan-binding protein [Patescibacteria group bacterium]